MTNWAGLLVGPASSLGLPSRPCLKQCGSSRQGRLRRSSLTISELRTCPRAETARFSLKNDCFVMTSCRGTDRDPYGTVRLIEKNAESFLQLARESYARRCEIPWQPASAAHSGRQGSCAILPSRPHDLSHLIARSGVISSPTTASPRSSRWEAYYPQFRVSSCAAKKHDPNELFRADW